MADAASAFMEESGDDVGSGNSTTQAALQKMIKAGNPAMFVNKASADTFGTFTKTDFLWSVVIRTRPIPPYRPDVAMK